MTVENNPCTLKKASARRLAAARLLSTAGIVLEITAVPDESNAAAIANLEKSATDTSSAENAAFLAAVSKAAGISQADLKVEKGSVAKQEIELTVNFVMDNWPVETATWMDQCSCADTRSRGSSCKQFQGETVMGSLKDDQCPGEKPVQSQECPCPDAKNQYFMFTSPDFSVAEGGADWLKNCDGGESRIANRTCAQHELVNGAVPGKLISTGADVSKCFFSYEYMVNNDYKLVLPDVEQLCPNNIVEDIPAVVEEQEVPPPPAPAPAPEKKEETAKDTTTTSSAFAGKTAAAALAVFVLAQFL